MSITKEVEKQLSALAVTNSTILRQIENMDGESYERNSSVDIWNTASRFYYTIGNLKDQLMPNISEKILSIRSAISTRSETLHDLETRVSEYNKKQSNLEDDKGTLKKLEVMKTRLTTNGSTDKEYMERVESQIKTLSDSIENDIKEQDFFRESLVTSLEDLISSNQSFVESSLSQLYQVFSSMYSSISQTFSSEIPSSILSLKQPLIENQVDKSLRFTLSAGATHDHSISMTKGSLVKWLFNCDDNTVRFSVVFTTSQTRESVVVEEEHRVKGDGRYDLGEYQCSEPGVLTLIWDNTYSLLSSRDVSLRIAVKHPKQETYSVEEVKKVNDQVNDQQVNDQVNDQQVNDQMNDQQVNDQQVNDQVKQTEPAQQQDEQPSERISNQEEPNDNINNDEEATSVEKTESIQHLDETFSQTILTNTTTLQQEENQSLDEGLSEVVELPKEVEGMLDE